jgi:hypothetical protein
VLHVQDLVPCNDAELEQRRDWLVSVTEHAHRRLMQPPPNGQLPLQEWPLRQLEDFLKRLWEDLEHGGPEGRLLLEGCPNNFFEREQRLVCPPNLLIQ